ncbi:hypothetical protein A2686_00460 [Candidatus Woesebacteria bacterium RIFCSPHIGHO2_01_FULL_38_10]|uniref:Uncharacterized protein n=1 Tax=Candidatus Woesebacteria bacterium RIFCSPLOWO2_01_FULL_39_10b TaxID=1802517 RepID=A0A1F8B538_9BACT|nr:MAG: hypothetical protein A2686_00460 [Candidatus Woesebacteria bacterium RIFCSPHIGHO2_01_FULL_38_10]OGM59020.1 MAG: hypothetical protein A2892_05280 [Candidatus Woesebacteria bacterium RIFCSPLOWO2_01_FULL_39_10b]
MALTKNDLIQISNLLNSQLDIRFEDQKQEIENLLTPFRSDMFTKIDPILKEVVTAREERPLIENRIEALEKLHPQDTSI